MDIECLKAQAQILQGIDYGECESVFIARDALDTIRTIVELALANGEAREVVALLQDDDLRACVGSLAVNLPGLSNEQRNLCAARIQEIVQAGGVEGTAAEIWLKRNGYLG